MVVAGVGLSRQTPAYGESWLVQQAISSAPQGLALPNYFDTNFTAGNAASLINSTNPKTPDTQLVQLTNKTDQVSWIWANDATKIKLSQNATASMWMFFDGLSSSSGDGMAFVMQNDGRGTEARATSLNGANVGGETLGVWGFNQDYTSPLSDSLVATAIKNSWALEFDTYANRKTDKATVASPAVMNAFDADQNIYGHIASNYPAQAATYQIRNAGTTSSPAYYAVLDHKGLIASSNNNLMTNGKWHHLTLKWNAEKKTMTYIYDDKNPSTGKPQSGQSQTVAVDPNIIDPDHTGFVRWGFTSSTGTASETNMVIFEKLPGLVNSESTATLTDTTLEQAVTDGTTVYAGDHLKLDYDLTYSGGSQNWQNIVAKLKLPANVSFGGDDAGHIGTVTYANGDTQPIPVSALSGQELSFTLKDDLSTDNPTAKITLNGRASHSGSAGTTVVASTTSNFVGSNAITTANVDGFNVVSVNSSMTLALTGDSASATAKPVQTAADATVSGKVTILGGTASDVTLHPTINGKAAASVKITAGQATSGFTYPVALTDLQPGENVITLYATDSLHDVSNEVVTKLDYQAGKLDFGTIGENVNYTAALTGNEQQVAPTTPWKVNVNDTRGKGSSWKLMATATPLVDGDKELSGSLVYKTNEAMQPLGATGTLITSHTNNDGATTPIDVASDWNENAGIFLEVNGGATAGTYSSDVTWTLIDGE